MMEQLSFVLIKSFTTFLLMIHTGYLFADTIYLAGGCFWCTEKKFENIAGVTEVISGYCNGSKETASYSMVSGGHTNHRECVQISYDSEAVNLENLIEQYIQSINPMDLKGQFNDRGNQYKIEIYFENELQKKTSIQILELINQKKIYEKNISVPVVKFKSFYPAEEYHQDFYKKRPQHYKAYEKGSGRKKFLNKYIERFNK